MLSALVDRLGVFKVLRHANRPVGLFLNKSGKSDHGVQRCSKLVRHVGEELGFASARQFGDFLGLTHFSFGAPPLANLSDHFLVGRGEFVGALRDPVFQFIAGPAKLRLGALHVGNVGTRDNEAAVRHRLAFDQSRRARRLHLLNHERLGPTDNIEAPANKLHRIANAEVASLSAEREHLCQTCSRFANPVRQVQEGHELAVHVGQAASAVKDLDALRHVLLCRYEAARRCGEFGRGDGDPAA